MGIYATYEKGFPADYSVNAEPTVARRAGTTCMNGAQYVYSPDFVDYPTAMRGPWVHLIPNCKIGGSSTVRFPPASQVRFERQDADINVNMPDVQTASGQVPNWKTSFSPVAWTYTNWHDQMFWSWNFRLLAPCTGNYTFQIASNGMWL